MTDGTEPASPLVFDKSDFNSGLTKREAFAMAAMQGLYSDPSNTGDFKQLAMDAVKAADALIEELNKTT